MDGFSPIDPIRRLVTNHSEDGQAIIWGDDHLHVKLEAHGNPVTLLWSSDSHPAEVASKTDKGKVETGLV
jgi:hypothetical protein